MSGTGRVRARGTSESAGLYTLALRAYRGYRLISSPERVRLRRTVRPWVAVPAGALVFEVGGGVSSLGPMIRRDSPGVRYLSSDIAPTDRTDLVCDAAALPLADGTVSVMLALEVLEHLPRPQQMLVEAARVLTADGVLVLTTPFMFGEHDFHDYYRYTRRGMAELVEQAGLSVETVVLRGGTFVSALGLVRNLMRDTLVGAPSGWRAQGRRKKALWAVATVVMSVWVPFMYLALALDRLVDRDSNSAPGYFFRCVRPATDA